MPHTARDAQYMSYFAPCGLRVLSRIVSVERHGELAIDLVSDDVHGTSEGVVSDYLEEKRRDFIQKERTDAWTSPKIIQLSPGTGGRTGSCAVSGKGKMSSRSSLYMVVVPAAMVLRALFGAVGGDEASESSGNHVPRFVQPWFNFG